MQEIMFRFGSETALVVIRGSDVQFGSSSFGKALVDISHLKLNYRGVCEEFPDLELRKDWREEAVKRFKEKIKSMKSEEEVSEYIINELKPHGYIPYLKRRDGFRPVKLS